MSDAVSSLGGWDVQYPSVIYFINLKCSVAFLGVLEIGRIRPMHLEIYILLPPFHSTCHGFTSVMECELVTYFKKKNYLK